MARRRTPARDEQQREDLGSATAVQRPADSPTEYRINVSDSLNKLALQLHAAFDSMSLTELKKVDDHFRRDLKLDEPPKAKQVIECLAMIGMAYTDAIGECAKQHAAPVTTPQQEAA